MTFAAGALSVPGDLALRVSRENYAGFLGYPEGRLATGRAAALARTSRDWFEGRARPWVYARTLDIAETTAETISLENGTSFASARLAGRLREIGAIHLVASIVTAGAEVDTASARLWRDDRPDEAYFLDRFGAAVAVHLGAWAGEHLRAAARRAGLGLGPGYSPGHDGWDIAEQVRLARSLTRPERSIGERLPGSLRVLESGMIDPKNSLLGVFGVSERPEAAEQQWLRHKCSWCSLAGCGLRGRPSQSGARGP